MPRTLGRHVQVTENLYELLTPLTEGLIRTFWDWKPSKRKYWISSKFYWFLYKKDVEAMDEIQGP